MSHTKEFPNWGIPEFIDELINDGIIEDHSWHNDEAAHFVIISSIINIKDNDIGNIESGAERDDQSYVCIWLDAEDPEMRERENPRWGIELVKGFAFGYSETKFVGDTIEELKDLIIGIDKEYKGEGLCLKVS